MSDNPTPGSVRRFGRKDRKEQLPPSAPLFPQYQKEPPAVPDAPLAEPDFAALIPDASDSDSQALEALAALPPDSVRPLTISPQEQRYPPLPPEKPVTQSRRTATVRAVPAAPPRKRPGAGRRFFYNLVTLLAVIGTVAMIIVYAIIWQEPRSYLNPFPPDAPFIFVTATPGAAPADAATPVPQVIVATPTFEAPPTVVSGFPFIMRDNTVVYIGNANGRGCDWSSIGGTVIDSEGRALDGYRVRVTGVDLDETVFSGAALTFGAGGFEMPLGGTAAAGDFVVQLFSPQGAPLSDGYPVSTLADCAQNVTLVNFIQAS